MLGETSYDPEAEWRHSRVRIADWGDMPKFTKMSPSEVVVGRGRAALEARKPFIEALSSGDAGRIDLERGDKPATVKRLLQDAAKEGGVRIRSSWSDGRQQVLLWKKVGSR